MTLCRRKRHLFKKNYVVDSVLLLRVCSKNGKIFKAKLDNLSLLIYLFSLCCVFG